MLTQKAQQESEDRAWKQDCRRTALQLSERFSKGADMQHESDPVKIIANAEVLYVWLTNDSKDALDVFVNTGILKSANPK